jgi:hypothetical protein
MDIRIRLPRIPAGLAANLLGLFGLIGVALAVGGLTGNWWWSVLTGAVFAVGLSYVAQTQVASADTAVNEPTAELPRVPLRAASA